jgi:hypothetical protein
LVLGQQMPVGVKGKRVRLGTGAADASWDKVAAGAIPIWLLGQLVPVEVPGQIVPIEEPEQQVLVKILGQKLPVAGQLIPVGHFDSCRQLGIRAADDILYTGKVGATSGTWAAVSPSLVLGQLVPVGVAGQLVIFGVLRRLVQVVVLGQLVPVGVAGQLVTLGVLVRLVQVVVLG